MKKKLFEFLPVFLFAALGLVYLQFNAPETEPFTYDDSGYGNARVVRVVDGDTLVAHIDGMDDEAKIRLLGVNTPESVDPRRPVECFGKEASAYLKELAEGRRVLLEEDREADERDKYGRLLRHVYLDEGIHVNALLIEEGYGFAYTSFPMNDESKAEFLAFERKAREGARGLWHPDSCKDSAVDR